MSTSETVQLRIEGANFFQEITVLDRRFRELASGFHRLTVDLEPGLYSVKFRLGDETAEQLVKVAPGAGSMFIDAPGIKFKGSLPLEQESSEFFDRRVPHTEKLASGDAIQIGSGALFFLFASGKLPENEGLQQNAGSRFQPFMGFALQDVEGNEIFDFGEIPAKDVIEEGNQYFAGINLELDPGTYILCFDSGPKLLYQTLILNDGWTTRLFLEEGEYDRFNLMENTVFLQRKWDSYNSHSRDILPTALALENLRDSNPNLPLADEEILLSGKFQNPILGVYWGHLATLSPKLRPRQLATVIRNTREMIPGHPDLMALALWLVNHHPEVASDYLIRKEEILETGFQVPPMLRNSWDIILQESYSFPGLIPPDSLTAKVADKFWGSGPWLIWHTRVQPQERNPDIQQRKENKRKIAGWQFSLPIDERMRSMPIDMPSEELESPKMNIELVQRAVDDYLDVQPMSEGMKDEPDETGDMIMRFFTLLSNPAVFANQRAWQHEVSPAGRRALAWIIEGAVSAFFWLLESRIADKDNRESVLTALQNLSELNSRDIFPKLATVWVPGLEMKLDEWLRGLGLGEELADEIHQEIYTELRKLLEFREISRQIYLPYSAVTDGVLDLIEELEIAQENGMF